MLRRFERLCRGELGNPCEILGQHALEDGAGRVIRVFAPEAVSVDVVTDLPGPVVPMSRIHPRGLAVYLVRGGVRKPVVPMQRIHPKGIFQAIFPGCGAAFPYSLRIVGEDGRTAESEDPYDFPPLLDEADLQRIREGNHYRLYEKLGAHVQGGGGAKGVHFGVWAPGAKRVSVVGDFNRWDGRRHPMRRLGNSGIWDLFVPGLGEEILYKFEVKSKRDRYPVLKADPYAFSSEVRPQNASVVRDLEKTFWTDGDWLASRRKRTGLDLPLAVYEVHPGSWRRVVEEENRFLTYRELAERLIRYVKDLGYTHLELLPVMEHPLDASWGYQTSGYFAATSRHGGPRDFMYFVDQCHRNGIGVILDWVPAHFPRDQHGLAYFDGTPLYEHPDPRRGEHPDWGTLIFNYGRQEVQNFLLASALFWLEKYHVDGLRVDAVASMLYLDYSRPPGAWEPNALGGRENLEALAFLRRFNDLVHERHPGVLTIAEESTAWPGVSRPTRTGGLGFDLKWNMGWMHDTLRYFSKEPVHRKYHHNDLTFSLMYAFSENFILALSHDEVVHGKRSLLDKMPGDLWQKFANLRAYYGYMYGHPGKKLLFMGGEFGQWVEWREYDSLEWHLLRYPPHQGLKRLVRDLNRLYTSERALFDLDFEPSGFEWIDFQDREKSIVAFVRRAAAGGEFLLFACNFTPVPRPGYRIGVPEGGYYREVLNSDAGVYGGGNLGNAGGLTADPVPWQGRPWSLRATLPPLSTLIFKRTAG